MSKKSYTKCQLQSLLCLLLYVHKCVKPAHVFLKRMLDVLKSNHANSSIKLTTDFHHDLRWFDKFLPLNGASLYDHKLIAHTLELDVYLTGLGGRWQNYVYNLQLSRGFRNCSIVQLVMINV